MLITMLIAAVGENRTLLQLPLGEWAFALAFRREVLGCLDVSFTAAASLPLRRQRQVNGPLLDELAPLLQTNLRAGPERKALRYRRLAEWRWRMRRSHFQRRLARPVRSSRGEGRTREVRPERCRTLQQYGRAAAAFPLR